jgi:prepilin-type N-terminal cleavage/methylation domain-containing protein
MRASGNRERGVTLIELLIVITLVAAISTGLLMALRIAGNTLEKTETRLEANRRTMGVQQLITRQIGGVMPVLATCDGRRGAAFNGNPLVLHLVSTYSWAEGARGYPRIVEYQVQPEPGGGARLVMTEDVYFGPASTARLCPGNTMAGPNSIVVAENLAYCRFVFHEAPPEKLDGGNWVAVWDRPNLPSAVRVEMAPREYNASRLSMATLHIPIHVNRDVAGTYVDY